MKGEFLKFLSFVLALFTFQDSFGQEYYRGCSIEHIDTNLVAYHNFPRTRDNLPSSFSLQYYSPSAGHQGSIGSCTSWASAYCAYTIVNRIEQNQVNTNPFNPLDLYNRLKAYKNEAPCVGGSYISDAAELLKKYGCDVTNNYNCKSSSALLNYGNRLFDYHNLAISTTEFKKAISNNEPIVIAAYYSSNCWAQGQNLNNGVWNGLYIPNTTVDAHAMTIIAYDDYAFGGAFLVQNSWGTGWGNNGCFWMRYCDMSKVVYQAISYQPSNKATPYNYRNGSVYASTFKVINRCSSNIYISLSQKISGHQVTIGWYAINCGSSITLDISKRSENTFYWTALARTSNNELLQWYDPNNGVELCYDKSDVHEIYDNASNNCPNRIAYYKAIPTPGSIEFAQEIGCDNVKTRGDESSYFLNSSTFEIKNWDIDSLNIYWDGFAPLIDLISGALITSIKSKGIESYRLYYVNDDDRVVKFEGTLNELTKLNYPKFANEQNASAWIDLRALFKE